MRPLLWEPNTYCEFPSIFCQGWIKMKAKVKTEIAKCKSEKWALKFISFTFGMMDTGMLNKVKTQLAYLEKSCLCCDDIYDANSYDYFA